MVGTKPSDPRVARRGAQAARRSWSVLATSMARTLVQRPETGNINPAMRASYAGEPNMKLQGQIALVTGGSRGIGRATALAFAQEGADIAFCHLDDGAKANETAAEISALGRCAMHRSVDVSDVAAGRAFVREVTTSFGQVDILFNNA